MRRGRLLALGMALWAGGAGAAQLLPYSVQMHLHASMSEGPGSMRGANLQARKLGLDVLWWSDHDWRVSYHTHARGYDFEGVGLTHRVPVPYPAPVKEQWMEISLSPHKGNGAVRETVARISSERAREGARSLEMGAAAEPGDGRFQPFFFELGATRMRLKRSLASGVELKISIYPEIEADKRTMAGVRVDLSQQPPDQERGAIYYVLTGLTEAELARLQTPHTRYVRLDFKLHQWNDYTLKVSEDAERLGLGGEDNSLGAVSFGVLTRGQRARAYFDGYRIEHRLEGEALREAARRMGAALQKEFGVINHVGQELSYQAHLNAFGESVPMIDHAQRPLGLSAAEAAEFVHQHGGVVSLNHYFGGKGDEYPEDRVRGLVAARCFQADLIEANRQRAAVFMRAWDALSSAGVYVAATGVSDSHSSTGGWFTGNNFVSWVWARSASQADLIEGLRRGNLYFGDPAAFRGQLSLATDDGHTMGQVVETSGPSHTVRVRISGLPEGARVRAATAAGVLREFTSSGATLDEALALDTSRQNFLRVEAYLRDGKPLVFSNPIYFRPPGAETAISPFKRADCR